MLREWHAFSRGHKITPLILGVTTTFSYEVLISSYKSNPDLVRLNQELGVDFIKEPSLFPLLPSLKTYYNRRIKITWHPEKLKSLGELIIGKTSKAELPAPRIRLLEDLPYILCNPRALFILKRPSEELKEIISKNFFLFEEQLKRENGD